MSTFKVPVTTIREVFVHPNADLLEIVKVYDWNVVVSKGKYKAGDKVVYVPVDSILPLDLEEKIFPVGSKVKLKNHRIRTIKLRKAISQGMILAMEFLPEANYKEEQDVSTILGITKYEEQELPESMKLKGAKSKKKGNPNFKKYTDIENFKYYDRVFQDGELVYISEKLHGCLRNNTKITLTNGDTKTIQDIVDNKLEVEVWGIDNDSQKLIPTKVVNWFNNGISHDWLNIRMTRSRMGRGNSFAAIDVTPNHQFYNPNTKQYVAAGNLKVGDSVLYYRNDRQVSYVQEQILIGKMLGDASYNKSTNIVTFGQKELHEDYLDETLKNLGDVGGNRSKNQQSGYGTTMCRGNTNSLLKFNDLFLDWISGTQKVVPASIANKLGPIALAYWYMDDGSLSSVEGQEDRAAFATCGFDEASIDNLVTGLNNVGISPIKYQADGYWRLRLNADEAEKLFVLISPYVVPCMRYKLPERYRNCTVTDVIQKSSQYKPKLVEQKIIGITPIQNHKSKNNTRYDIETECHNFIADGVVVHNSSFRAGWFKNAPDTLWKKILFLFGALPEWEFCWGSRNVQIQSKLLKKHSGAKIESQGVDFGDVYTKMVDQYSLRENIPKGFSVYGEIVGPGIQRNYAYGCANGEHKLFVYDIMDEHGKWLDYPRFKRCVANWGLERVPELYVGPFSKSVVEEHREGDSTIGGQKVREGVVVKPLVERQTPSLGRLVLKAISEAYYLNKDNTEFH